MIDQLLYWIISLLFVIALILGMALLIKKFALPNSPNNPLFKKNKLRRLEIIDQLPLDHKSRLVLIRRDETEHLLMLGQSGDLVIETNIPSKQKDEPVKQQRNELMDKKNDE